MIRRWMWPCDPTVTDMHRQTHNTHTHTVNTCQCAHTTHNTHTHTLEHTRTRTLAYGTHLSHLSPLASPWPLAGYAMAGGMLGFRNARRFCTKDRSWHKPLRPSGPAKRPKPESSKRRKHKPQAVTTPPRPPRPRLTQDPETRPCIRQRVRIG